MNLPWVFVSNTDINAGDIDNNITNISDLGSGINFKKKGLKELINLIINNKVDTVYLTNKDRLLRFGTELIISISEEFNTKIKFIYEKEETFEERLSKDILENITKKCIEEGFYSISIEKLTFDNNKYKYRSKKLNRLLMKFPFEMFASLIKSKTTRKGLKLKEVNPKYTSFI